MLEGLAVLTAVFGLGFACGFAARAWKSHRRRARLRRERTFPETGTGGV